MKKIVLTLPFVLISLCSFAQKAEKAAIKATIERFFQGLESGDTTVLKSACMDGMILQSYITTKDGKLEVRSQSYRDIIRAVGQPRKDKWDEQIEYKAIALEESLANVWTPYKFYLNGNISHCGTNSFQLVKRPDGWKIQYIIDTRRKNCG
jgi:Putative lumazine-binding